MDQCSVKSCLNKKDLSLDFKNRESLIRTVYYESEFQTDGAENLKAVWKSPSW